MASHGVSDEIDCHGDDLSVSKGERSKIAPFDQQLERRGLIIHRRVMP